MAYNNVTSRSSGQALIPEVVSDTMLTGLTSESAVLTLVPTVRMSTNVTRMPVLAALPTAYFVTGDTGLKQTTEIAWANKYLNVEELAVIAPDSNRSATARSITIRRPLWVEEVDFGDGTVGYATDGTPVDCVRFATLGLIDGFEAELIVSGINHGSNLGDAITYSGTVAAA